VGWRLQTSEAARWVGLLVSDMFESVLDGTTPQKRGFYRCWIDKFEQQMRSTDGNLTPAESQGRLSSTLEVCSIHVFMNICLNIFLVDCFHQTKTDGWDECIPTIKKYSADLPANRF
jgi:hypothetical protein